MRGIDTIQIVVPLDIVQDYNKQSFNELPTFDEGSGHLIAHRHRLKTTQNPHLGLNQVELNTGTGKARLNLSAKILREDYHRLITSDTIERAIQEVNNSGIVKVDSQRFIDEAGVERCDITQNIPQHPEYSVQQFNSILAIASLGSGYNTSRVKGSDTLTLTKGRKRRITSYNKSKELMTANSIKQFGQIHASVLNSHKDIYRIEDRYKNYQAVRDATHVRAKQVPPLLQVLNSEERPLLKTFNDLTKSSKQLDIFLDRWNDNYSFGENIELLGYYQFIEAYDLDLDRMKEHIYLKIDNKNTAWRYLQRVKSALIHYQQNILKGSQSAKKHPIIEYVRTYLQVA